MARADKAAAVAELTERFGSASAAVLTEYRGLSVAQLSELRRSLGSDATYTVVKNTLTKIAAKQAGLDTLEPLLEGPSAIAFVTGDPVTVAKGLRDFARSNPELVVKGGILEGRALSAAEIRRLADLESREVLLAKLAGAMKASLQQAVSLFAAPLSQAARVIAALEAKAKEDPSILAGGAGAPAPAAESPLPASEASEVADSAPEAAEAATDVDVPTDGTPGVEEVPAPPADQAGDPGAQAQAVADAVDPPADAAGSAGQSDDAT